MEGTLLRTRGGGTWVFYAVVAMSAWVTQARSEETLWLEAEHFQGIRGYCWPMGRPEMKVTQGHWGLSGPGWAAEWCQGGESGFLSIAAGGQDDQAVVSRVVEIPYQGDYHLWVRYADRREMSERFVVRIQQPGRAPWQQEFGRSAVVEEDNEMKLYFGWAFGWDHADVSLASGTATIQLATTAKDPEPRQVDVIVLTTDASYRPWVKERPRNHAWDVLDQFTTSAPRSSAPLARKVPDLAKPDSVALPDVWQLKTFRDRGFLYLWNVSHTDPLETWLSDRPDRVPVPYNIADKSVRTAFEAKFAGRTDVPIFSDPRLVPTFHGVGAGVFATDPSTGEVKELGKRFAAWLDSHPDRAWAMMMNYHPGAPIADRGISLFEKYRSRFVGSISGESLGYFYPDAEKMRSATAHAQTRRQLVEAFAPITLESNREKYRQVYGRDLDANPYHDVIACLSVGNLWAIPLCARWGARTVGYESSAATSSLLAMRWAFLRGAARQRQVLTCTYRSCNFGDSSTIFSDTQSYTSPRNIFDNYYSVFSGAGMTWYKMDIWYQYIAGASMFYHEQGFDEYWQPGGTTAAGLHDVQLSPKGKLVDRFLRVTAAHPDRGTPYTPIAFLIDYAHGWEPAPFWPNAFKNWHGHADRFLYGDHEKMLEQYFWAAYHPIGRLAQQPMTALNEVYVPGIFGDIFDVIFAYPEVEQWRSIDSYPVVIAVGELELTEAEGKRLAQYIEQGGTLLLADGQITGPGAEQLSLPPIGQSGTSRQYVWLDGKDPLPAGTFRYREIAIPESLRQQQQARRLATTPEGRCFCASFDRGQGRLIYLSVPYGLCIDRNLHPVVAHLLVHLTRGLMPIEVEGDVEWFLNRKPGGWLITLLNPYGQSKPQHGITPTDYSQNRKVTIRSRRPQGKVIDWLAPDDQLLSDASELRLVVPAGSVRIIEWSDAP